MDLGGGNTCLGTYEISEDQLTTQYDPGQSGCLGGTMGFQLSEDGNQLTFGIAARYRRVDSADDTTF